MLRERSRMELPQFKPFSGPLYGKHLVGDVGRAYCSFRNQKERSKRDGLPAPAYSAREFVGWWLENIKHFKGKDPTCGRKNHSAGYSFENIEIQSRSENGKEGATRSPGSIVNRYHYANKVLVRCKKTGELIAEVPSYLEAASLFGVSVGVIRKTVEKSYQRSARIKIPFVLEGGAA